MSKADQTVVKVAVGIIFDSDDKVLIARRQANQHQGNRWEFPGGKVERGENSQQALRREIHEELGIDVQSAEFMMEILHHYVEKSVLLIVYTIRQWRGEARGCEGQPIKWVDRDELAQFEFPEANQDIVERVRIG